MSSFFDITVNISPTFTMRILFFTNIIHFLIRIQPTTSTRPISQFKTGLNPKNDQIFRDFVQISQHRTTFYKKMRKCNLNCYVSEKCAQITCSKCRKKCVIGHGLILNSKCLENVCHDEICKGDNTVNSITCRKCQKKCFKSKFRKVFASCFGKCTNLCFKKASSIQNRRNCRVCVSEKCFFEP